MLFTAADVAGTPGFFTAHCLDSHGDFINTSPASYFTWHELSVVCMMCRIVAGPGSGKTRVLTARVEHLIRQQGCKPWQLVVITFSNKAARELQERLETLLGANTANQVVSGTMQHAHDKMLAVIQQPLDSLKFVSLVCAAHLSTVLECGECCECLCLRLSCLLRSSTLGAQMLPDTAVAD